uniref:Uncharacterized protein n=1 Tax=Acrobeloides nanus TaxID=290746 RepID=A0A914E3Q3_9BILA
MGQTDALVHIVCPRGVEFYTSCDGSFLAFSKAYINASCAAVCSDGSTNFRIVGQLFYLPQLYIYNPDRSRYDVSIPLGIDWLTIMESILEWLIRDWRKLVIIAIVALLESSFHVDFHHVNRI